MGPNIAFAFVHEAVTNYIFDRGCTHGHLAAVDCFTCLSEALVMLDVMEEGGSLEDAIAEIKQIEYESTQEDAPK
jgi:hypothetical protein